VAAFFPAGPFLNLKGGRVSFPRSPLWARGFESARAFPPWQTTQPNARVGCAGLISSIPKWQVRQRSGFPVSVGTTVIGSALKRFQGCMASLIKTRMSAAPPRTTPRMATSLQVSFAADANRLKAKKTKA